MSGLRVLISGIVLGQPMGGVRRHNAELLPRLADLITAAGGELAIIESKDGLAFDLPASVRRIQSKVAPRHPLMRAAQEGRAIERALEEARERPFHVLHTAHFPVPRRLPIPLSLTLHDLRSLDLAHTPFSRRFMAKRVIGDAVKRAARVITVSSSMALRIAKEWPAAAPKLRRVSNAADHLAIVERAAEPDLGIMHVGHVEERKNLMLLIAALAEDVGLPDLHLFGRAKGNEEERLRAYAEKRGVQARVHFHGPFEEEALPDLYSRAACVVLPSHVEGFGISAVEAARASCPLAVSNIPALREVAGEETPSFEPDDPHACAQALRAALQSDAQTLARGRERAAAYSWQRSAEDWYASLEEAAGRRNAGSAADPALPQ